MFLSYHDSTRTRFGTIRRLTKAELELHNAFTPNLLRVEEQLKLFTMLDRNYTEWAQHIRKILNPDFTSDEPYTIELNRLLLNYLTFAYTIFEHFTRWNKRRNKGDKAGQKDAEKFNEFLDRLYAISWPFAFLLDFRGYVQHVGMGIGGFKRKVSDDSVSIKIYVDSCTLRKESRDWKRSNLTADKGRLDLIPIVKEFHIQMFQSYRPFVIREFFPFVKDAATYYKSLTSEATGIAPNSRMIFSAKELTLQKSQKGKTDFSFSWTGVPNDVYAELGIPPKE